MKRAASYPDVVRALLGTLLLCAAACGGGEASAAGRAPLLLAAAASLGDVLPPLLEEFERQEGCTVRVVLGGSGELAAQLRHGAPFDALILAGEEATAALAADGWLHAETVRTLAGNALVLVVAARDSWPPAVGLGEFLRAAAGRRIAIGGSGVPAGEYARRWLAAAGVEPTTLDLVPLEHVRSVLAAVEGGSCAAGFVYATDAAGRPALRVALTAPAAATGPIRYPAAVASASAQPERAGRLLEFLRARAADFQSAGFAPPP